MDEEHKQFNLKEDKRVIDLILKDKMKNSIDTGLIKRAELLAIEVHKGQKRKCGEDFINHPRRIVGMLQHLESLGGRTKNFYSECTILFTLGWVHDVVEDTDFKLEEVEVLFGTKISNRLDFLTKRDGWDYYEYGKRIMSSYDRLVYLVKLADLEDNLNSVGDGAFSREVENKLTMRWEWLRYLLNENLKKCD